MNPLKYVALLNQSSSSDPVATVLENTLGGDIVWTRHSTGYYLGTRTGAFPADKTVLFCNPGSTVDGWQAPGFLAVLFRQDDNTMIVVTQDKDGNLADTELSNTPVQIMVYP